MPLTQDEISKIMESIKEYIFQSHKFPSISEISETSKISKTRCREICDQLVQKNMLYVVFEGQGVPKIYVPYDMMQGLLMTQKKPEWVSKHSLKERDELIKKSTDLNTQLVAYDMFERLLYATDIPLEASVAFALKWLEFKNVVHYKENPDNPDITFEHEGKKVLVEVEGTIKNGGKAKVLQLDGWIRREIDKGKKVAELQGIFVINHFREMEPNSRGDPLGPHAKEYLKRYNCKFLTTPFLFRILKRIKEEGLEKEDARKIIWQGEKIA